MTSSTADNGCPPADDQHPAPHGPGDTEVVPAQRTQPPPEWRPDGELLPPEEALLNRAATGTWLNLRCDGDVDLDAMRAWGPERTVRAAVLRHLLVDDDEPIHAKGVKICGARIIGPLDLQYTNLRCPLTLDMCYLDSSDPINLTAATVPALSLTRCHLSAGITAHGLTAKHGLAMTRSSVHGPLNLSDAHITGNLACGGVRLTAKDHDGDSLFCDRMTVDGAVFLGGGFTAAGAIRLFGADIKGQLACSGAQLTGTDQQGDALVGDGLKVADGVFLDGGFTAAGAIRLSGADIKGPVVCSSAQLTGTDQRGNALVGERMTVDGAVFLDGGFTAAGAIRLTGADLRSQLDCSGAQLTGTDQQGDALVGDGLKAAGDVFLSGGFTAEGALSLSEALVEGALILTDAELRGRPVALSAVGLRVEHEFRWSPRTPVQGLVDLERASVHRLDDDWRPRRPGGHWPPSGSLRLAGFTYGSFGGDHQATADERLAWARKSHTTAGRRRYVTSVYEQLAHVYRQAGQDTEAQQVAIARRTDLRRYGHLTVWRKAGNWVIDVTIRHGYKPGRVVWALVALYFAAFAMLWHAQHQDHVIVPVRPTAERTLAPTALACSPAYPCYYPAGHAFDTVVPIVETGQSDDWRVNGDAPWGAWYTVGTWIFTGLGWALTSLAVIGFTGVVRKE